MTDQVGDLAHLITGCIASRCCHVTGGYNHDPKCECRDIAESLIDSRERVIAILGTQKKAAEV